MDKIGLKEAYAMMGLNILEPDVDKVKDDIKKSMTGEFMTMDYGKIGKTSGIKNDTRHLWAVFGLVAAPVDFFKHMHKFPTIGFKEGESVLCSIYTDKGEDKNELRGHGIGRILTSPIWRV